MTLPPNDKLFAGSVPLLYEQHMVPMLFAPYAADLARRVAQQPVRRLLELAAGTGALTRQLAATLSPEATLVATDLNQPMLDLAAQLCTTRPITWQTADAMALPFEDASFDTVVCQFGVMFFPDKARAFAEARRVLQPGGRLLFNVWDRIEDNHVTDVVQQALAAHFPLDPPVFMSRTPHGYFDLDQIARHLRQAGFTGVPHITTVSQRSRAPGAGMAARALCQGSPLRGEILARTPDGLDAVTALAEAALRQRYGAGPVDGQMQAHVLSVAR
jgi:ubiquinone/menaquinone biosynthesis C-methylase UbiE